MSKLALGRGLGDLLRQADVGSKPPDADAAASAEANVLDPGVRALVEPTPTLEAHPTASPTAPEGELVALHPDRASAKPLLGWTLVFADVLLLAFAAVLVLGRTPGWPEFLLGGCAVAVASVCGSYAWSLRPVRSSQEVKRLGPGGER